MTTSSFWGADPAQKLFTHLQCLPEGFGERWLSCD